MVDLERTPSMPVRRARGLPPQVGVAGWHVPVGRISAHIIPHRSDPQAANREASARSRPVSAPSGKSRCSRVDTRTTRNLFVTVSADLRCSVSHSISDAWNSLMEMLRVGYSSPRWSAFLVECLSPGRTPDFILWFPKAYTAFYFLSTPFETIGATTKKIP